MKLLINQNQVGKFNLGGDNTSLAFSLKFTDDEGNILKVTDEGFLPPKGYEGNTHLAVFKMPSPFDDDPEDWGRAYKDLFEDMDFESLLQYHIKHNGWTTGFSYEAQRTMFVTLLDAHYDEITAGINQIAADRRKREIEDLERRLKLLKYIEDFPVPDKPDLASILLKECDEDIEKYLKWRSDYVKDNESWLRWDKRLKEARAKKAKLVKILPAITTKK